MASKPMLARIRAEPASQALGCRRGRSPLWRARKRPAIPSKVVMAANLGPGSLLRGGRFRLPADPLISGADEVDQAGDGVEVRSEERRVGKEGVSTCRSRWSPSH